MSKAVKHPNKSDASPEKSLESKMGPSPETGASAGETAKYIAEFTAELSYLAQRADLGLLSYLLDMARLEAIRTVKAQHEKG
ncbi:hypothetical protein ACFOYU_22655 [Microvirga sp. GCM10011540]|uniref:hypothetical protein n=1 Tax=Microvirga sp. GCM10011540 TaxID=3317338 RepID=UPI0036135663